MQSLNPSMPKGIPLAGVYGALANGWGVTPEQPEGFSPTPAADPQAVLDEDVTEVPDDGEPVTSSEELDSSGE